MTVAHDHFIHVSTYQLAVCRKCHYAVWPNEVPGHLASLHPELSTAVRAAVLEDLDLWPDLCHREEFFTPLPESVAEPVPGLCISLLDHDLRGALYESIVVGFLAVLGIDAAKNVLREAYHYTPTLSGFIKISQMLVIQYAVSATDRGSAAQSADLVHEMRARFLVSGTRSPFCWASQLRVYGKKIRDSATCLGYISWSAMVEIRPPTTHRNAPELLHSLAPHSSCNEPTMLKGLITSDVELLRKRGKCDGLIMSFSHSHRHVRRTWTGPSIVVLLTNDSPQDSSGDDPDAVGLMVDYLYLEDYEPIIEQSLSKSSDDEDAIEQRDGMDGRSNMRNIRTLPGDTTSETTAQPANKLLCNDETLCLTEKSRVKFGLRNWSNAFIHVR